MSAVEVTISGVLYDKQNRTTQNVVLIGEATLTGLGVGGGPIVPPGQPQPQPPGIWGPTDPRPTPPIELPPGAGSGKPPGIWGPLPGFPTPPIALPPEGEKPPEPIQPPVDWKAVWHPTEGWIVVGIPNVPAPTPS